MNAKSLFLAILTVTGLAFAAPGHADVSGPVAPAAVPQDTGAAPVPEPTAALVFGLGVAVVAFEARQARRAAEKGQV